MFPLRPVLGKYVKMPASASNNLDRLPPEVMLNILSYLDIVDLIHWQRVSSRYLELARDNILWQNLCYDTSLTESLRRRQQLREAQDILLTSLRNAVSAFPTAQPQPQEVLSQRSQRKLAMANWEPGYPDEKLRYYDEYIHRHASINVDWLDLPKSAPTDRDEVREATGIAILTDYDKNVSTHIVSALDDGSISIFELSDRSTTSNPASGKMVAQSHTGLLSGQQLSTMSDRHAIMTETGAVECVSIDSSARRGYFAVKNFLHEVDLNTLQLASTKQYPFPITAISEASRDREPITVGTNLTIHLHDPRDQASSAPGLPVAGELIGGSLYSHATLAQPGPLSILHDHGLGSNDSSIWVAGRFTSLLNYDRRFFPRLRRTVFSGARIASLTSLPYPYLHRKMTMTALQEARHQPGATILAAAEYKGKGSLELYGLPEATAYQNRQTASASKLLSVASHGGLIVFSDGDGNLKWVERDAFTNVRTFNINEQPCSRTLNVSSLDTNPYGAGIWSSTGSEGPGQGDIVKKILPLSGRTTVELGLEHERWDINQNDLLLWTGDGRVGVLGYGPGRFGHEEWHNAVEQQAQSAEERAREDAERQYGMAMRRALERNADEVRFVRGLGMLG